MRWLFLTLIAIGLTACGAPTQAPAPTVRSTATVAPTPTEQPTSTPALTTAPASTEPAATPATFDHNGDGKVTCGDFTTQAEAKAALAAGYKALDNDGDGVPCESLP